MLERNVEVRAFDWTEIAGGRKVRFKQMSAVHQSRVGGEQLNRRNLNMIALADSFTRVAIALIGNTIGFRHANSGAISHLTGPKYTSDFLFAHVYLDPINPPEEVMLQWHSENWLHRAYWGSDLYQIETGRQRIGRRFPERAREQTADAASTVQSLRTKLFQVLTDPARRATAGQRVVALAEAR